MSNLSIVIITHNSESCISASLTGALNLIQDIDGYIIVYDDWSEDSTRSILSQFEDAHPDRIAYIPGDAHCGLQRSTVIVSQVIDTSYYMILNPEEMSLIPTADELRRGVAYLDLNTDQLIWQSPSCSRVILFRNRNREHSSANRPLTSIHNMFICVGQACNLKCKNCGNLAPYSPKEYMRYDVNEIISDIASILKYFRIEHLGIQGGEPFLYSDIDRLLVYLGDHDDVCDITIATNGLIQPKAHTMELLHRYNITVRISDYQNYNSTTVTLKKKLEDLGIRVKYYQFAGGTNSWSYMGGTEVTREENDSEVQARFQNCDFRVCTTLENGRIAHCSRAMNAARVQGYDLSPGDTVTVRGNENLLNDITDYYDSFRFMESCRYCFGTSGTRKIDPAEQI